MKRIFSIALVALISLFTACGEAEDNGANFKLTSTNACEVDADGGSVAILYSIKNRVSGSSVSVTITSGNDAVKNITQPADGVIIVEVNANTTSDNRIILVHAAYGAESFDVVISQKSNNGDSSNDEFDVVFEGDYFNGFYYGQEYSSGADLYAFFISDKGLNNAYQLYAHGTYYYIYIYAPVKNSTTIPYGAYTFVNDDTWQQNTVVGAYSRYYLTGTSDEDTVTKMLSDATVKVAANRITLELTIDGKRHKVVYNGTFDCVDARENGEGGDDNTGGDSGNNNNPTGGQDGQAQSTLTEDRHVTFDGEHRAKWGYEGDYWKTGYSNYTIFIMNKSNGYVYGDTLQFDLITDNTSKDGDFDGKYTISNTPGKMVMMAGFTNNYAQSVGSWLYEYGGSSATGYANYAMIKSGSAEFIKNSDGTHTVKLDGYDYLGNNITCNWTGVIEEDN